MSRSIRTARWIGVMVAVGMLLAPACGPSPTPEVTEAAPTEVPVETAAPVEAPTEAPEPIQIGFIANLTGIEVITGESILAGAMIAVDEVNAAGGVNGRPIELLVEDSENRPEAGVEAAHKLIDVDGVRIIIGATGSGVFLAWAEYAQERDVIAINTSSSSPLNRQLAGTVFAVIGLDDVMGGNLADWVYELGYRRAALLNPNNSFGVELARIEAGRFPEDGGEIVERVDYEQNQADYRPDLLRILAAEPDVIMCGAYGEDGEILFRQAMELGLTVPWYCMYPTGGLTVEDPAQAEGLIFGLETGYIVPSAEQFYRTYRATYGSAPRTAYAVYGYDAVGLIADVLRVADLDDPDSIRTALHEQEYEGATGRIIFDEDGARINVVLQKIQLMSDGTWAVIEE